MRGYGKQLYVAGMCVVSMAGVCGTSVGAPPAGAAHVHPTEGPHHGALIELGKEEYHAELVHDDRAGFVTIYILDGAAKTAVPIQAKEVTLNLLVGGKPRQFRLAALAQPADPAGMSSAFTAKGADLCRAIDAKDLNGRLNVEVIGKMYTGSVGPHTHSHAH